MSKVELYNCWDAVVNGTAGEEELDNILSILDFPMESFEGEEFVGDWDATKSEFLGPIPSDVITIGQPMIGRTKIHIEPSVLPPAPIGPIEDTSASFIPQQNRSTEVKEQGVFQTQSPVSVLENNSSSSAAKTLLIKSHIAKRARSKRARKPLHLSPWLLIPPLFATCPLSTKTHNNSKKIPRDRRRKISHTSVSSQTMESSSHKAILQFQGSEYTELQSSALQLPTPTVAVKKCTHCQVTKTPQWREGPMGPKTLCNACGVRYRSGRLFPEYRPAASPTFVPTVHSNSHKKVIEMRTKGKASRIEESRPTEFVPMSSYLV